MRLLPAALLLSLALGSFVELRGAEKQSVLLITIDTLRADRLGRRFTPNIDALAGAGIRFENAVTPVPLTLPAHASLLTGLYPMYHQLRDFSAPPLQERFTTLAEIYKGAGYRTAAFVSAFVLDSLWGLDQGFDVYHDHFESQLVQNVQPGTIERPAEATIDAALLWLEENSSSPFFLWVHLFDPHSGYNPPEPFRSRFASQLYDGEVAYADAQLGRLFQVLKRAGLYDTMTIVFTSDHGESLGEHGEAEHGFFLYDSTLRVPLIFKAPGLPRAQSLDDPASLVDVAPTLLQMSGLRYPEMQGRGLYSLMTGKSRPGLRGAYSETLYPLRSFGWHELRAYRTARYKYIDTHKPELYDLREDPGETANLLTTHQALAQQLDLELQDLYRKYSSQSPAPVTSLSPEALEKLKSLGYVAYSGGHKNEEGLGDSKRSDPKDKIGTFNRILQAMDLAQSRQWEASNRLLQEVMESDPGLPVVHNLLGQNQLLQGRIEAAIAEFRKALQARPDWEEALFNLARAYWEKGDLEAAQAGFELVLRLNPRNFLARFNLGSSLMSKSLEKALQQFQEAQALQPDFPPLQRNLGIVLTDLKRFTQAEGPLRKALKLDPQDAVAHNYLGIVYRNTDRAELAVERYREALRLNPAYLVARLNLAFAYRDLGEMEKARLEFEAVCQNQPDLCRRYRSYFR